MEGLSRALGVGPTIEFCGETFLVKGRVLRFYALMEAEIIKERVNPLEMMRVGASELRGDPESLSVFVRECLDQAKTWKNVTGREMRDWLATVRGRNFLAWLSIRDNDPQRLTLETVSRLVMDDLEDVARSAARALAETTEDAAAIDKAALDAKEEKISQIERVIDQASGDDELGNLNGHGCQTMAVAPSVGAGL